MNENSQTIGALGRRLALASALLGWLFDGAEMGMFSLVGRPALRDLLLDPSEENVGFWFGLITAGFLIGAATGGVLFGWLGDRAGRVPAMMLSVLTYAIFTGACGLARGPEELAGLRFIASLGMGGEWSLGVALVMELWPDRSRAFLAGLIGAAANVGFLLIGLLGLALAGMMQDLGRGLAGCGMSAEMVAHLTGAQGWRLMMLSGIAPALLAILLRLSVPESNRWREEKARGAASHWRAADLAGVLAGALAALFIMWLWSAADWPLPLKMLASAAALIVAALGYMFPVTRYFQRAGAGHAGLRLGAVRRRLLLAAALSCVPLIGTWASLQWAPTWADRLTGGLHSSANYTQIAAAVGAVLGSFLAALLGNRLGRRNSYRLLCVASYASILWLYRGHDAYGVGLLVAVFVAGLCTASFYGWLPLYLPELFPTSIRATGQGFGYNFGRVLAAICALQTGAIMGLFSGGDAHGGYPRACSLMSSVYLIGLVVIAFAPETRGQKLSD